MITLVRPTHASLLPRLARTPEELSSAYAASSLLESFSILLGPLLAGGLMGLAPGSLSGPGVVDAALAAMLFLGTVSVASIRVRTEPAKDGGTSGVRVVASDAVDGVRAVARDRRSLLLVATMGLAMVQLGFVDVLIVVLAFDVVGTGDAGVGFLTASIGVGAVVGAMLAIGVAARWRASRSFRWGVSWSGLSIAGIAAQPALAGALPGDEWGWRRARRRQRAGDAAATDPGQAAVTGVRGPGIALHGRRRGRLLPRVADRRRDRAPVDLADRRRPPAVRGPAGSPSPHRARRRDPDPLGGDGAPALDAVLRPAPHADARASREEPHPDPRAGWIRRDHAGRRRRSLLRDRRGRSSTSSRVVGGSRRWGRADRSGRSR